MLVPDNECFSANVTATYNVIEAASKLGVKKIITASSETTYGVCFSEGDTDYHSFPLEEDYDVDPMDSYALSKICGEKTARGFARRFGNDIYVLRVGNVVEPHEYERDFPTHVNKPMTRNSQPRSTPIAFQMTANRLIVKPKMQMQILLTKMRRLGEAEGWK